MKLIGCTPDLSVDNTKLFSWKIEVSDFASEFNGRVSLSPFSLCYFVRDKSEHLLICRKQETKLSCDPKSVAETVTYGFLGSDFKIALLHICSRFQRSACLRNGIGHFTNPCDSCWPHVSCPSL